MSIDVNNESGTEVDEQAVLDIARYALARMRIHPLSELSVIGSSNFDMRSFSLDLEISVMVRGASFLSGLRAIEDDFRANSRELTLEEWRGRSRFSAILDNLMRLTAVLQ